MSLTIEEIVSIRHHLGYLNVQEASTFVLGVPAAVQTQFMIEGAVVKVLAAAEPLVRRFLERLDRTECKIDEILEVVALSEAEEVKFNQEALKRLAQLYKVHQQSLANLLGVPPNPFDMREYLQMGSGINVPVSG